jgi:hypothetical protein
MGRLAEQEKRLLLLNNRYPLVEQVPLLLHIIFVLFTTHFLLITLNAHMKNNEHTRIIPSHIKNFGNAMIKSIVKGINTVIIIIHSVNVNGSFGALGLLGFTFLNIDLGVPPNLILLMVFGSLFVRVLPTL